MVWNRDASSRYLYNLTWNSEGYTFFVTDLKHVYKEILSSQKISERGDQLGMVLALNTPQQQSAFLKVLLSKLGEKDTAEFGIPQVRVNTFELGVAFNWKFQLRKLNGTDAKKVLGHLVNDLFGVIENIGKELRNAIITISDKNTVLTGINEALQRHVDYVPPRHLQDAFTNRQSSNVPEKDTIELVSEYWPEKQWSVLEHINPIENEGADTNADADADAHADADADADANVDNNGNDKKSTVEETSDGDEINDLNVDDDYDDMTEEDEIAAKRAQDSDTM